MKKKYLEIITSVGAVAIFIVLIASVKLLVPSSQGYGYTAALLVFVVIMGFAGLRLAAIPEK